VHSHQAEIANCFATLAGDARGELRVNLRVDRDGRVLNVAIARKSNFSAELEQCVVKRISTWIFPTPRGGLVDITYPFRLLPPAESDATAR
jgi:TonB family protein